MSEKEIKETLLRFEELLAELLAEANQAVDNRIDGRHLIQ